MSAQTRVEVGLTERKFRGQVEWGQFFAICADVFYGLPLGLSNKYFNVYYYSF